MDLNAQFSEDLITDIRMSLESKGYFILREVYDREKIKFVRLYLSSVMRGSLPNYQLLKNKIP
jgi:hypothetical protein